MMRSAFLLLAFVTLGENYSIKRPTPQNTCMYTVPSGRTIQTECNDGQVCYALLSVYHANKTWHMRPYSLGCWEPLSQCTAEECVVAKPKYVWLQHHFPRFCCCVGALCNQKLKFVD